MPAHSKKVNFAREQLEDAIELYFDERYISAITLLGAFATAIEKESGLSLNDENCKQTNRIRSYYGNPHMSKRESIRIDRRIYNSVKHYDIDEPESMHINRSGEAFCILYHVFNLASYLGINFKHKVKLKNHIKESCKPYTAEA